MSRQSWAQLSMPSVHSSMSVCECVSVCVRESRNGETDSISGICSKLNILDPVMCLSLLTCGIWEQEEN